MANVHAVQTKSEDERRVQGCDIHFHSIHNLPLSKVDAMFVMLVTPEDLFSSQKRGVLYRDSAKKHLYSSNLFYIFPPFIWDTSNVQLNNNLINQCLCCTNVVKKT
jgi:hypothetical protein